jgi:predicted GIY-YIG superfamily endonuclease
MVAVFYIADVPAAQKLLFADPRPLVERLGPDFFRRLPESPGVYMMRDLSDTVLYVGKAKNLRKRLGSYRVANPERLPRRHLRLLRAVDRIEIQECATEGAAFAREAELLRSLRPRFNRAGTWPSPRRYLGFNITNHAIQLTIIPDPPIATGLHGPHGAGARHLRNSLARLLWLALHAERGLAQLPLGWFRGLPDLEVSVPAGATALRECTALLESLFRSQPLSFAEWMLAKMPPGIPAFEKAVIEADLEFIIERFGADAS